MKRIVLETSFLTRDQRHALWLESPYRETRERAERLAEDALGSMLTCRVVQPGFTGLAYDDESENYEAYIKGVAVLNLGRVLARCGWDSAAKMGIGLRSATDHETVAWRLFMQANPVITPAVLAEFVGLPAAEVFRRRAAIYAAAAITVEQMVTDANG